LKNTFILIDMRNFSDVIGKYARRIDSWLYIRTRYARSANSLEKKLKSRTIVPLTGEQKKSIDDIWNGKKCDKRWFEFYNSLIVTPPPPAELGSASYRMVYTK